MQSQALDWEAGKMRAFLRDLGGLSERSERARETLVLTQGSFHHEEHEEDEEQEGAQGRKPIPHAQSCQYEAQTAQRALRRARA